MDLIKSYSFMPAVWELFYWEKFVLLVHVWILEVAIVMVFLKKSNSMRLAIHSIKFGHCRMCVRSSGAC